jgi:hypothetical protein
MVFSEAYAPKTPSFNFKQDKFFTNNSFTPFLISNADYIIIIFLLDLFNKTKIYFMSYYRSTQQYPPGTQNNYVVFLNLSGLTETGKELNYPKGGKGF